MTGIIFGIVVPCIGFYISGYYTCRYRFFRRAMYYMKSEGMITTEDLIDLCPGILEKIGKINA